MRERILSEALNSLALSNSKTARPSSPMHSPSGKPSCVRRAQQKAGRKKHAIEPFCHLNSIAPLIAFDMLNEEIQPAKSMRKTKSMKGTPRVSPRIGPFSCAGSGRRLGMGRARAPSPFAPPAERSLRGIHARCPRARGRARGILRQQGRSGFFMTMLTTVPGLSSSIVSVPFPLPVIVP